MVGYWKFNETLADPTVFDSSPVGNDGTLNGARIASTAPFLADCPSLALSTWKPDGVDGVFVGTDPVSLMTFDASVGITGYAIESFEDPFLMPGLTVEGPGLPTTSVIPPDRMDTTHPDSWWDFVTSLLLDVNNTLAPGDIVFRLPSGVRSFAVGIADVESNVELFVDGESFGLVRSLPNFKDTGNVSNQPRQIYIRIDAGMGFPDITEVRFTQIGAGSGDILYFDRLALFPATVAVPVPGLGLGGGLGAVWLMIIVGVAAARHARPEPR